MEEELFHYLESLNGQMSFLERQTQLLEEKINKYLRDLELHSKKDKR